MTVGFTGTQVVGPGEMTHLDHCLVDVTERLSPAQVVTGACVGVDAYVHHWYARNRLSVRRVVVVPAKMDKVDRSVLESADEVVRMPPDTVYRARNVELVRRADVMVAFWTGKTTFSGTWMTMNISRKMSKLQPENVFGMGALGNQAARDQYFGVRL